jgi:integrase
VSRGSAPVAALTARIAAYAPRSVSERAGAFAREVVGVSAPASPVRAKALLFAAGRLASFAESLGLELSPGELLCEATIERFILTGTGTCSPATRRTLRSNLRSLARALEAHPEPRPVALPRERAKAPYSQGEIEGYLRLAGAQPTEARRMRCAALICLGAGAGIVAGELRHVRGADVIEAHGGMLVRVSGRRARSVAVLTRLAPVLREAASFAGERLICGGSDPCRRNITDALVGALCADPSLPRLEAGRLRSTWLAEAATRIGLEAFMAAAGLHCSQRLGDIACSLRAISEAEMVALLGGSS